jgi:hypothetical protein
MRPWKPPTRCPTQDNGNALFLILIAVVLFAALSYAVTQSGRGGGSVDKEQDLIVAAQITQYAAQVRSAVDRLLIFGTPYTDLELCLPSDANQKCSLKGGVSGVPCTSETAADPDNCVFAEEGGGVPLIEIPEAAQASPTPFGTSWAFVHEDAVGLGVGANIQGVGTTAKDIFMYTELGITLSVCEQIDKGLGLLPIGTDADRFLNDLTAYDGEAFFCFDDTTPGSGQYLYVHTLVER